PRILDGDGDETAWVDMGAFEFDPTAPPADPCVYAFCPADLQVDAPRGQTAAIVDYPLPAAPTTATVTCTPPPGSTFHEGTTPVTCTAALTSGDTATCEFAVTVVVRPL